MEAPLMFEEVIPLTFEAAYVIAMAIKHRNNPNLETARQLHNAVDALLAQYPPVATA